ncbi:MAG: FAD/NAD(P)-binding protein [Acidobacteriota bacterium]
MADNSAASAPLRRVAIVGAGPSGFYTAAALLKAEEPRFTIDLFDRLPAPYGLVRYGVAPDHPKIKAVSRVFEKLARDPRLRFRGNVEIGRDVTREELLTNYDYVVYSVGGQSDRRLGVAGEDLTGSFSSTAFVAWYSGHPDFIDLPVDLTGDAAVVVGIGNVAIDVARVLARPAEDLASTDIADLALERLRDSRVSDLYVLARRGPAQAKCTPAELKELAELDQVDLVVDPRDLELDPVSATTAESDRKARKNLEILRHVAERPAGKAARRIHLKFLASPVEILEQDGRVQGVRIERNRLRELDDGYLSSEGTGETEDLEAQLVVRAIGYRSEPLADLPFDDRRGIIPNRSGRIVDPAEDQLVEREYVAGWVKRGPTGLIGSNKPDGNETAAAIIEDATAGPGCGCETATIGEILVERGVREVSFDDWTRIDAVEVERGAAEGRPRVKMVTVDEMLACLE